jgi:hypothetical protein
MVLDARFRGHDSWEATDFFSELVRHHPLDLFDALTRQLDLK